MDISETPPGDDPEGKQGLVTSSSPGDSVGPEELTQSEEFASLDETSVLSEGQPPSLIGLVVRDTESRRREQAAFWSDD